MSITVTGMVSSTFTTTVRDTSTLVLGGCWWEGSLTANCRSRGSPDPGDLHRSQNAGLVADGNHNTRFLDDTYSLDMAS